MGRSYLLRICCLFFGEKQIKSEIEDLRSYGLIAMDILMLAFFLSMVL
jgi:hypothetical protein